jgi:hypothetical protein
VAVIESRIETLSTGKIIVERRRFLTSLTPDKAGAGTGAKYAPMKAGARGKAFAGLSARLARGH